jgi:pimeloyl-ACP methyl ester carboxylesterase
LAVWGTDSDVLSEAQAWCMAETLPKGQLLSISGVGHAPSLVEPASLTGLERFLGGVLAPTGG